MLVELDYNLTVPTAHQFVTQLLQIDSSETLRHGAEYLAEQTLMCAKLSGFRPSMQAAACVYLTRRVLGSTQVWSNEFQKVSLYDEADLCEIVNLLEEYIVKVLHPNPNPLNTVPGAPCRLVLYDNALRSCLSITLGFGQTLLSFD